MKIVVLGAGAWGTAIAIAAARSPANAVVLWARESASAALLAADRENRRYLPAAVFPERLVIGSGCAVDCAESADLVIVATPVAALAEMLGMLAALSVPVVWLCKGFAPAFQGRAGRMPHEVCSDVAPALRAGALSGPSFAQEVAQGRPAALVAASTHEDVRSLLVTAFHGLALRVYANDDVVGVEVGGAVKNVLAIATGLCDGLQLGLNARAALVTRGLAEMTRLGLALGARQETFMGLSGLGDLVLTATGDLSRNRKVGMLLADGRTLQQAVDSLGHVAEGVYCAETVVQRARMLGVEMPIAEAVLALLQGTLRPADAVVALMERLPVAETF